MPEPFAETGQRSQGHVAGHEAWDQHHRFAIAVMSDVRPRMMNAMEPEHRGFHREAQFKKGMEQRRALRVALSLDGISRFFGPHWTSEGTFPRADAKSLILMEC